MDLPAPTQITHLSIVDAQQPRIEKELLLQLERAKEYVLNNLQTNPGIGRVARAAQMSQFHFHRMFKQVYGITPHKFSLKARLQLSLDLLRTDTVIKDIAGRIGFADIFTFSKAFKREYGVSPAEYRRTVSFKREQEPASPHSE